MTVANELTVVRLPPGFLAGHDGKQKARRKEGRGRRSVKERAGRGKRERERQGDKGLEGEEEVVGEWSWPEREFPH